eukprot:CAMPEP_0178552870 /NCGR_PEP_ID=MMETSP0697-20121206/7521_1 /TAXON_ID=265572 /ORGANISM="Extubocellulus spinifer, Strain CCMP396" /LENGTH=419 /DNA_ID=CAMNT_0020185763 /DNA_START=117 /DNA_END=1374 /DNA_ORIENTATION=-
MTCLHVARFLSWSPFCHLGQRAGKGSKSKQLKRARGSRIDVQENNSTKPKETTEEAAMIATLTSLMDGSMSTIIEFLPTKEAGRFALFVSKTVSRNVSAPGDIDPWTCLLNGILIPRCVDPVLPRRLMSMGVASSGDELRPVLRKLILQKLLPGGSDNHYLYPSSDRTVPRRVPPLQYMPESYHLVVQLFSGFCFGSNTPLGSLVVEGENMRQFFITGSSAQVPFIESMFLGRVNSSDLPEATSSGTHVLSVPSYTERIAIDKVNLLGIYATVHLLRRRSRDSPLESCCIYHGRRDRGIIDTILKEGPLAAYYDFVDAGVAFEIEDELGQDPLRSFQRAWDEQVRLSEPPWLRQLKPTRIHSGIPVPRFHLKLRLRCVPGDEHANCVNIYMDNLQAGVYFHPMSQLAYPRFESLSFAAW